MADRTERTQVCIVGAGPAGLAAASEATRSGVRVILLDAGAGLGGQFWRHAAAGSQLSGDLHHDRGEYARLASAVGAAEDAGQLVYLPEHHVWSLTVQDDGCVVNAICRSQSPGVPETRSGTDSGAPTETVVRADYLILATGAYDLQIPFPGWDIPGVMTIGAVQALLKGNDVLAGQRVVLAGTGPFLLPVAAGLAGRGAQVLGVHEAASPLAWLGRLPLLARNPAKVREAVGYGVTLARHRVPLKQRSTVVAASGPDRLRSVTVARLDRTGRLHPGSERTVATDILAVGWGFQPQLELALAAGCALRSTASGDAVVQVDHTQRTSQDRVFAAGEATGVGGAQLALAEGTIAGAAAARAARLTPGTAPVPESAYRRRDELRRFAAALDEIYQVPASWLAGVEPDTVLCRCEEVTVADLSRAVALGARDLRTAKLLSRAGMGWCQGRICGYATACLVEQQSGTARDPRQGLERAVASPLPLGLLARPDQPTEP